MDIIFYPILELLRLIVVFYNWALIIYVILHLLMVFHVLDKKNNFIASTYELLHKIIEPFARFIRKMVPMIRGFDLSIIVLFIIVLYLKFFFEAVVTRYFPAEHLSSMMHMIM